MLLWAGGVDIVSLGIYLYFAVRMKMFVFVLKSFFVWRYILENELNQHEITILPNMPVVDTKTCADKPYATSDCRCAAGRFLVDDLSHPSDDRDCC
jgi:hypothetical protein